MANKLKLVQSVFDKPQNVTKPKEVELEDFGRRKLLSLVYHQSDVMEVSAPFASLCLIYGGPWKCSHKYVNVCAFFLVFFNYSCHY